MSNRADYQRAYAIANRARLACCRLGSDDDDKFGRD